jgi:hypothetical protein
MFTFWKKKPARDWNLTGREEWRVIKEVPGHRLLELQKEAVDMNSGETVWWGPSRFEFYRRRRVEPT